MTGYVTTCTGEVWQLPVLLEWEVLHTDGDSCDSAQVGFLFEPKRLSVLKEATRLRLEEDGKTVFFGVVDEFSARVSEAGRLVTLTARGLQALLMDSQLRAAEFSVLQLEDAIRQFVTPFGVTKVKKQTMTPVRNFSVETGTSPWQALRGFCRHSGEKYPRFSADGTLLLEAENPGVCVLTDSVGCTKTEYRQRRYGVISRQLTVTAGQTAADTVENTAFQKLGGICQKVNMKTGKTLKATWRTGAQRVADSVRQAVTVTVTVPRAVDAVPGDTVRCSLESCGIVGDFLLKSVKSSLSSRGRLTVLEMEGGLA